MFHGLISLSSLRLALQSRTRLLIKPSFSCAQETSSARSILKVYLIGLSISDRLVAMETAGLLDESITKQPVHIRTGPITDHYDVEARPFAR
ncbi:hypothetical protein AVEN_20584-1 [Araneus ventricosus]|uniref:Uncharacterized protein n=1 Tax=Araneus ventricosus TaxID=182803 RepID=A0A4Y2EFQ3_ARAVE|nr:hypothetical protein AVEN_20584-1 [Araneus ventricosus]